MARSPAFPNEQRMLWSFWLACGLAVAAGVSPFVFGGGSRRLDGAVLPFALAAIALGACARLYTRGKLIISGLYFLASLAIVYGILAMLALPVRLAVTVTCPPAPAACGPGFERALTGGESNAFSFAVGIGIVAIVAGYFGLATLYRRQATPQPLTPPARQIAAVAAGLPTQEVDVAAAPVSEPKPEYEPELPPHTPNLELAAPAEPLELPEVGTEDRVEVAPPAPQRKPRRKRVPKATPDTSSTPDTDASV